MERRLRFVRVLFFSSALLVGVLIASKLCGMSPMELASYSPSVPALAALLLLGVYCFKAVTMVIPIVLLYICAGILFSPGWAIAITYACIFAETTIGYAMGKYMGHSKIEKLIRKNGYAERLTRFERKNCLVSVILLRQIPGPPVELVSMVLGASGVEYPKYIAGTLLSMTPGMIPAVLIGDAVSDPRSPEFLIALSVKAVLVTATIAAYRRLRQQGAEESSPAQPRTDAASGGEDSTERM